MADVASTLSQWSTTASSNSPSGSTSIGSGLDDNLRQIQAVVAAYLAAYNGTPVASSGTTDIGGASGLFIEISGTTTITAFGSASTGSPWKVVRFQGALTLTHNATSLILPGGANITTAAGDYCLAFHRGSGNWTVPFFQKATGEPPIFINGLTAETAPAVGDLLGIYDISASANRKMTLSNMLKVIGSLTAASSPSFSSDQFLLYSIADSDVRRATLGQFIASTSASGIVELANSAETIAGSDPARVLTPFGFSANSNLITIGHYIFPGNFIINWGSANFTGSQAFTFSQAFNSLLSLAVFHNSATSGATCRVSVLSTSGLTLVADGLAGASTNGFIAVGT